jgi:EmrB/QacA subfamily drug resistance transporter
MIGAVSTALPPICDRAIAEAVPAGAAVPRHARMVLATCILASSLAFVDGSVVNVGLPAIGASLHAGGAGLSSVINGYLLPLSALLLIGGACGDRYGRRRVLVLGIGLFALASLSCAAAPSLAWLVAGRVLQGAGAALLLPNSLAILGASFTGEARGRAVGIWAAVGAAGGAAGPLLGGWLIDAIGWRMIFLINLPIAALAVLLASRCLVNDTNPSPPALDLAGAAMATLGLAALTWGLTRAGAEGLDRTAWAALGAGLVMLGLLLYVEKHRADNAMLPMSLFGAPGFAGLNVLTLFLYGALGALLVLLPFVLIEAAGYSATAAGAALIPLPVVIALGSPVMGRLAGKIGARGPLTLGPVVVAAGFLLATRISPGASYWTTTLPAVLVIAAGMAGAVAPLTTAVLSSVDREHTGLASGFNSAVARLGGLIATALLGAVLSSRGAALVESFHLVAIGSGFAALIAGVSGFVSAAEPGAVQ